MSTLKLLPSSSRVWIFSLSKKISSEDKAVIDKELKTFLNNWEAHSAPVYGAYEIKHEKFLIVAADIEKTAVSGCSIDSLFREVERIANLCSLKLLSNNSVFYLHQGEIIEMSRNDFKQFVAHGSFHPATTVFNNTVQNLAEYLEKWEVSFSQSWHAQAFPISAN